MLHSSPPIAIIRNYHKGKPNVVERTLLLRFLMTEVSLLSLLKVTLPRKLQLSESFLLLPFLYPVGFFFLKLLEKKGVDGMNEDRVPKTQPLGEKACLQCTGKAQELCLDLHIFSPHYVNPTEQ